MIEIKRWDTGEVIHAGDFADLKECLEDGASKGVNFFRAKLNYAELNYAELSGAKLNDAKLNYAELNYAELNYAELSGAELNGAELNYAELNYAELSGAKLNDAKLNDAELPNMSACICAGEDYYLFLSPDVVQAGCQSHSPEEWRKFTKKEVADMDGKRSLKYYPRLLDLMDLFLGSGDRPEWLKVEGE